MNKATNHIGKSILLAIAVSCSILLSACTTTTGNTTGVSAQTSVAPVTIATSEAPVETEPTQISTATETTDFRITGFDSLGSDEEFLIALGNSDVPVGQYSEEILTNLGYWEALGSKISFCGTVREVLSQVSEHAVDCGIVYATDAATDPGVMVIATVPEGSLTTPVEYPFAPLLASENPDAAAAFLSFLQTSESKEIFETAGFVFLPEASDDLSFEDKELTLTVFAAASLTDVLTAASEVFTARYPGVTIEFNFDSSGTLKTQIENGAYADIFISAATKQTDGLISEGYIDAESVEILLANEVVLIVPAA